MASLFIYKDRNHHTQRKMKKHEQNITISFKNVVYLYVSGKLFIEITEEIQK